MTRPRPDRDPPSWTWTVRRAEPFFQGHGRRAVLVVVLTVLLATANALEPLVLKWIIDALAGETDVAPLRALAWGAGALLGLALLREAFQSFSNWLVWRVRLGVHYDLLERTVGKLHSLPVEYHRREGVGGMLTRLDRSITGFLGGVQEMGTVLLPSVVYLAIALTVMIGLDWRLTLVVLAFVPLPPLLAIWAAPEQGRRESVLLEQWVGLYSRFNEVLGGIVTVRSFAQEEREKRRFLVGVQEANRTVIRGVGRDSSVGAARNVASGVARVAAVAVGGWLVLEGDVTLGTLVAFLGYVGGLFGPVQGITQLYGTVRRAGVSLDQILTLLEAPESLGDPPEPVSLAHVRGRVEFRDVHFGYREDRPLLRGISLIVEPGETLAFVGPSGSGKSTLMSLLQRLYDPWDGRILVDGKDIRNVRQRDLRAHLGVVLQDPLLFQDTVRDNIAYGRPGAAMDAIVDAARAARAEGFIEDLPQGYDTLVGERGSRLSVGERQRIAIARALLKDPPILILDEPTSALDVESEVLVQEALDRLRAGRTSFIIAHRLSTVVDADRIVVLSDGRIAEEGDHAALMDRDGIYADMVRTQVGGLLSDPRADLATAGRG